MAINYNWGVVDLHNRAETRRWSYSVRITSALTGIWITAVTFKFGSSSTTRSISETAYLDGGPLRLSSSGENSIAIEVELTSQSSDPNYNLLTYSLVVFGAYGTTSSVDYVNGRMFGAGVTCKIDDLSCTLSLGIKDTWGPTVYYFRRNGTAHTSTPTQTTITASNVSVDIVDYGDYYIAVYNYTYFAGAYNVPAALHNLSYSGHTLSENWTQIRYEIRDSQIYFYNLNSYVMDVSFPYDLSFNELFAVGAIWFENICPKIAIKVSENSWCNSVLGMRVLNSQGVWSQPSAMYIYDSTQGWVRVPTIG